MATGGQGDIEDQLQISRDATDEWFYQFKREQTFVVSEEFTNASAGDTSNVYLRNPAGSGVTAIVPKPVGNPAALSWVRVYDDFSGDPTGSGTDVTIQNNLLDSGGEGDTDPGTITAERDVTFSATDTFYSRLVGGGIGDGSHAGAAGLRPFAIEPGRRVVIEVEKVESGQDAVAISADFYEVPVVFSEESLSPDPLEVFPS